MSSNKDLGLLVRSLRDRMDLTQERFAAKLGVTFASVNRWENGRAKPSPLALKQIEELLLGLGKRGADLHEQFFGKEEA